MLPLLNSQFSGRSSVPNLPPHQHLFMSTTQLLFRVFICISPLSDVKWSPGQPDVMLLSQGLLWKPEEPPQGWFSRLRTKPNSSICLPLQLLWAALHCILREPWMTSSSPCEFIQLPFHQCHSQTRWELLELAGSCQCKTSSRKFLSQKSELLQPISTPEPRVMKLLWTQSREPWTSWLRGW